MARSDGRRFNELRRVEIIRGFTRHAAGSALIRAGGTHVLCTACWETGVPSWRKGSGKGWVTAEYDMLPGSTSQRKARSRGKLDGRTQEIQRLVGRALRAVVDMDALGEHSILIDCDVLQADGGTRTASITGAYVALCDAVRLALKSKWIAQSPVQQAVAAVSVGIVHGKALLDLNYEEDVEADVDMNIVMTGAGGFVEVQGTGEESTFTLAELDRLVKLARGGIQQLLKVQARCLRGRPASRNS
ncbi:MAG: ribonuclease PH [Phycisphaerales bacterium]|nr:ribonuclease PH [Phycisphaerales bacterium]